MGVTFDEYTDNAAWKESKSFSFELWTDQDATLAMHLGAADTPEDRVVRRLTRVFDAEGNVILEYRVGLNASAHTKDVFEDVKRLQRRR